TVALTRLAASARLVEAETAGFVPADLRFRHPGEEGADLVEDLDVGGGVGTWRAADGRLIDVDDLVDMLDTEQPIVCADRMILRQLTVLFRLDLAVAIGSIAESLAQGFAEDVVDERAFAGSAHARHSDEQPERNLGVDVLEVVLPGALDAQPAVR